FPALFANRKHEPRISAVDRICFILLLALILFIAGKYGIVRMDPWHIIPAVHYMILIAAFCSVMPGIALKWRIVLITPAILLTVSIAVCYGERVFSANCTNMLLVFLAALLIYVLNSCAASNHVSRIIRVSVSAVFIFLAGYKFFLPWAVGQMNNYRAFSKHVPVVFADIPQDSPVTADCFSHEIFYLLQSKVKYAPRFVFQSYSAYTPQLLQKNASHFEYDSGPDYIFLGWQEIDGKLPSSFDSLSLLKIMNNYEAVPGKMLLSKKKERPAAVHLEEIRTENADFDGRIDLPQGEPFVWISIDFQESAAGFLLKKLVKPSSVLIRINLDNGRSVSHLINPEICSIPFLLSPYLPGWQYLDYMLISEGKDFPKVTSFSVFPFFLCFSYTDQKSSAPYFKSGGQWDRDIGRFFFKEGIKVHFYRMASSSVNQEKQRP
ncbi:MAG: hypothetical protein J5944_09330, partial [Lentisphaeria bacterium]|nr:hypothetical protein [Lentisphaeria bacterium]